ncbi:MAG: iron-containing alcohol dehydrogenase [Tenuifilaceae bacterium]|nr:iron-containing alcohol dehydrogenase [Tenuifilaceae bacterium]
MKNFDFYNPVKILFGEGKINEITNELPSGSVVLITYGGGSIKRNGVYTQVMAALNGFKVIEFGGIEPNPRYETLMKAVEIARTEKVDFILAVGGGSVIDGTKFISAAIPYKGNDPWDLLSMAGKVDINQAVPFGTVLTLPATGSEMNMFAVISRDSTTEKLSFGHPLVFPKFSVLDPTVTYSLPVNQIANGVVDAFVHVIEQYLTYPVNASIQDRWAEGVLQTLIEIGPQALANPMNYDVRANVMWSCTMALNGLLTAGVPTDWATHTIGHELTAFFGLDHAVTLSIVLPSLMREMKEEKRQKILQFAQRVWGIDVGTEDRKIDEAIAKTEAFFQSMGIKTRLNDYGITEDRLKPIFDRFDERGWKLGEMKAITSDRIKVILRSAL